MQSSFNFPFLDNYRDDDFLLSKANEQAFDFVNNYDQIEQKKEGDFAKIFALIGKKSSGKSHLCHIWRRKMNAEFLKLNLLKDFELAGQIEPKKAYIIENIEEITNQIALFHIFNIAIERDCYLMLTCNINFSEMEFNFSDLKSRLQNIFTIEIQDPDIDFVKMLLVKQFSNRQLMVEDKVIDYLAKNTDRDYDKIVKISKLLEFYCFEQKRKITIPFVTHVLDKMRVNDL